MTIGFFPTEMLKQIKFWWGGPKIGGHPQIILILVGFPPINHPFWGDPHFWKPQNPTPHHCGLIHDQAAVRGKAQAVAPQGVHLRGPQKSHENGDVSWETSGKMDPNSS